MRLAVRIFAAAVFLGLPRVAHAQLNASVAGTGFSSPTFATSNAVNPGTLYVTQRSGDIRALDTANPVAGGASFLNVRDAVGAANFTSGGETGLLGLAFHPDYATNGRFYVHYTAPGSSSALAVKIDEFTATFSPTGPTVSPTSRRNILTYDTPKANGASNHNAGWIGFNPRAAADERGHLYITSGDSGSGNDPNNVAQNRNSLQGKMLRIDVNGTAVGGRYSIPSTNNGTAAAPEVYSYGLRNPYRSSFDRGTGNLYIADVGQGAREEINFVANGSAGGQNFGWRVREGTIKTPNVSDTDIPANLRVDPIHDYDRSQGQSITGGYVYRGTARDDNGVALDGAYIFGDYVSGNIWAIRPTGTQEYVATRTLLNGQLNLAAGDISPSSFAEDGFGNLYLISFNGTIYQIVPVPEPAGVGLLVGGLAALVAARRRGRRA